MYDVLLSGVTGDRVFAILDILDVVDGTAMIKALMRSEMKTASSKIWTRLTDKIINNGNRNAGHALNDFK